VAITDDGVQLDHKDLKAAIWQNTAEIPDNGKDDDNNGYVDDTVGWDFSDDDNNPTGGRHGTHVAGIVGASTNEFGGAGVAPGVKLMAIRWYGGRNRWTSKIIMKSYAYAVDNGAKIINTSYNIDGFANDKTYLAAVDYVYEKGGIIFNSAGNGARLNSPRQKVEKVVLVASTQSDPNEPEKIDKVSSFSNYGKGVDIAAPGNPIYSTVLSSSSNYGNMSGTSMASPNAAGAAALIWSKFPKLTRAQVLQALYKGADNINKKILKKYVGNIGAGRVNTLAAIQYLQNESARANVIDIRQNDLVSGFSGSQKTSFKLSLSGSLSADQSLSEGSMLLVSAGDDGLFDTDDDKVYPLKLNKNYSDISQSVEVYTDEKIESGFYAVSIKTSQLKDAFGRPMGGNISSNSFIKYFSL
jgi:subtilisin family serine protease